MREGRRGGRSGGPRVFLLLAAALALAAPAAAGLAGWTETFAPGRLDPAGWQITRDGDFRDHAVDVVDAGKRGPGDFRLRLRTDTRGTRDETVKFLGIRSTRAIPLRGLARVAVELDWNDQANGSYLSAALILSPHVTAINPLTGTDWLKVEYVGVPPGRNVRMVIAVKAGGRERVLFTEGWPDTNRAGRRIGLQRLALVSRARSFEVWENGGLVYASTTEGLPFAAAYLYLQMSSHSNYPAREIYFGDVRIEEGVD